MSNVDAQPMTAVQEVYSRDYASRVLFGSPERRIAGARGPILLFGPGSVVGYRMRVRRYAVGCIFRTVTNAVDGGDAVPGVSPSPLVLFGFLRGRQFSRALMLLRELRRRGVADTLPSASYLRAAAALYRPSFDVQLLARALEDSWTC